MGAGFPQKKSFSPLQKSLRSVRPHMKPGLKIALYVILTAAAIWLGVGFYKNYRESSEAAAKRAAEQQESDTTRVTGNSGAQGRMMGFAFGLMACAVGLGVLISSDVSRFFANRTVDYLFNDNAEGVHNPDYDAAEQVAMEGRHLEAVGLLREFLKKNPGEIYAAIRIAEIYEKDLQNHLAAALEYEEVLKHKFNADRWGWTAIHLVNIYSGKLNKQDQAMSWLQRIVSEYPSSAPAKKARERLGLPEFVAAEPPPPEEPPPSTGGLPPGLSPRKR